MRPLVRLLLRHGVTYTAFAAAQKRVFLDAARDELAQRGMAATSSALTLLSGVHRRDVRELSQAEPAAAGAAAASRAASAALAPLSVAGEVVARWMSDPVWQGGKRTRGARGARGAGGAGDAPGARAATGARAVLPRSGKAASFDALVASVSRDVRPRAMLDELLRLGVVTESADGIALLAEGFAPRKGLAEMSELFADNLHDHIAAASANLQGGHNFLEQAVHVDQLTPASIARLQKAASVAWMQAFKTVMHEAQQRFDGDAALAPPEQRNQRARFGVYFYNEPTQGPPP